MSEMGVAVCLMMIIHSKGKCYNSSKKLDLMWKCDLGTEIQKMKLKRLWIGGIQIQNGESCKNGEIKNKTNLSTSTIYTERC